MTDNVSRGIKKIVNVFKQDVVKMDTESYLYNYFEKANRYKKLENKEKKDEEKEVIIKKKIQDFLSTNKNGRSKSITAKMLLELCSHSENCRVSLVEIFENSTNIEEDINTLESFLKESKKDALLPIKIDADTGGTIYIRYKASRNGRLDYIVAFPVGEKIFDNEVRGTIEDGLFIYIMDTFYEANEELEYISYACEGLNEFRVVDNLPARMKKYIPEIEDKEEIDKTLSRGQQNSDREYEKM